MRLLLIGFVLVAVSTPVLAEKTETSEFLRLSADHQAAYVAGILQGMSYVMFNYDRAGYEKWDACVHAQNLEATVADVLRLLNENPNESRNPVPWAVTRAIGKHC
jgi:hypothetical protein